MSEESGATEVAVLGGGPGGYAAAFRAADLGKRVALIDEGENPGGVCLYRGCIPSKALLHVAKVIAESREAAAWGVEFPPPKIDLNRMRAWKEDIVTNSLVVKDKAVFSVPLLKEKPTPTSEDVKSNKARWS